MTKCPTYRVVKLHKTEEPIIPPQHLMPDGSIMSIDETKFRIVPVIPFNAKRFSEQSIIENSKGAVKFKVSQ